MSSPESAGNARMKRGLVMDKGFRVLAAHPYAKFH